MRRGNLDNLTKKSFMEVVRLGELLRRSLNAVYLAMMKVRPSMHYMYIYHSGRISYGLELFARKQLS